MSCREGKKKDSLFSEFSINSMFEIDSLDVTSGYSYLPFTDIIENAEFIIIEMELPGVKKNDINIEVSPHNITIEGVKYKEEKECEGGKKFHCMGRSYGKFKRTFEIHTPFNSREAKACLNNGLLVIQLPKVVDKRQKKIKISVE